MLACWEDPLLIRPEISVRRGTSEDTRSEPRRYEDIQEAFDKNTRVVVLGQPGAGKSTALHRYAHRLARQALEEQTAPIPFYVRLGFWMDPEGDPEHFVRRQIGALGEYATGSQAERDALRPPLQELAGYLLALCKAKRARLLLDGLNELPSQHRERMAGRLKVWLAQFPEDLAVDVACRKDDYREGLKLELDELTIEPLSVPRIRTALDQIFGALSELGDAADPQAMAEGLFWALAGGEPMQVLLEKRQRLGGDEAVFWAAEDLKAADPERAERLGWDERWLWRDVRHDPHGLLRLAANPYMLTLLIQHWRSGEGTLPANQSALFHQAGTSRITPARR